ncbi:unnamed protein product [Tenebrio molitor]|nr:unnamed protein product [Tenebrio molitor]
MSAESQKFTYPITSSFTEKFVHMIVCLSCVETR